METSENQQVKTKRQLALERMQKKYPDEDFNDEEGFFGKINDDFDEYDKQLNGYKEREKTISDMFTSDPRSASFLASWHKGEDPAVQLVRMYGEEIRDAIDDPERQEQIAAANKEYVERMAKEKDLEEQYQQNLGESLAYLDRLQDEDGVADEEIDAAMQLLVQIANDALVGKFTPENIDMALKAINHDRDVADADATAEVRGRNATITERLRRRAKGDGTPQLDGANGGARPQRKRSIFDVAADAR